jgi:hypothetical protein
VPGDHELFICGNDEGAKAETVALLGGFGWPGHRVLDLGGIVSARGTEMVLPLWVSIMRRLGHARFNLQVRQGSPS